MKLGIIHYNAPGETLTEFLDYAQSIGCTHVELAAPDVWPAGEEQPERTAEAALKAMQARGLAASAIAAHNDFIVPDEETATAQVARLKRICALAKIIDTDTLRVDGGWSKESVPESKWMESMLNCFTRCPEFIEPMGIKLALDNHGTVTNAAGVQLEILRKVGSPNMGVNLDTMNYRWYGHDIATIDGFYETLAPYVKHTHLKDGTGCRDQYIGAALGDGEIHLEHAITCLKKAGYTGAYCAEYEGKEDSAIGYRKCVEWLKAHVG
jgi:sugar phosphate isomerase/epimerase